MRLVCAILLLAAKLCYAALSKRRMSFYDLNEVARRPLKTREKLGTVLLFFWHDLREALDAISAAFFGLREHVTALASRL